MPRLTPELTDWQLLITLFGAANVMVQNLIIYYCSQEASKNKEPVG